MKRSKNKIWMFYQEGNGINGVLGGPRIRLVYPDGHTEWTTLYEHHESFTEKFTFKTCPCWATNEDDSYAKPKSRAHALKLIREFDKEERFPKQVFIGEL